MPTLNDEAWRRTDLRPFKWNDVQLSALDSKFKPKRVPATYLKPLVGKEQGGQLVINAGKIEIRWHRFRAQAQRCHLHRSPHRRR